MISPRLVRLIETHADQISASLAEHLRRHPRTMSYRTLPESDIRHWSRTIYGHLGAWTTGSEEHIRKEFEALGRHRAEAGVPLHELIYALLLHKSHLLSFMECESVSLNELELLGENQLRAAIDHFYDLAIYFAAIGHEDAAKAAEIPAA